MTKHELIKQQLLELIDTIESHHQIPSERLLETLMDASRMTVRKAIDALVHAGHLYRKEGTGTFKAEPMANHYFSQYGYLAEPFYPKSPSSYTKVLSLKRLKLNSRLAKQLDLPVGTMVIHMRRLRLVHHEPLVYDEAYYIEAITGPLTPSIVEKSTLNYLEQVKGILVHSGYYDFHAMLADESLQLLLSTDPLEPLMKLQRRSYSNQGEIIDVTYSYVRTNKYDLLISSTVST
jgi:DNA-binding GntR family transcriptional regulator